MENPPFNFENDVIGASYHAPVIVDFWAPWCDPCLLLEPILNEIAQENLHKWKLIKINIDNYEDLANRFHIRSVPTVSIFYQGEIYAKYNGLMWKKDFARWIDENLPRQE